MGEGADKIIRPYYGPPGSYEEDDRSSGRGEESVYAQPGDMGAGSEAATQETRVEEPYSSVVRVEPVTEVVVVEPVRYEEEVGQVGPTVGADYSGQVGPNEGTDYLAQAVPEDMVGTGDSWTEISLGAPIEVSAGNRGDVLESGPNDSGGDNEGEDGNTEQIRAGIEQTRSEMADTINAIQEKLKPQVLMDQAKEKIQEATMEAFDHARDSVKEATVGRVEQMVSDVTDTAKGTSSSIVELIKDNPVPAALAGLGIGWLFRKGKSGTAQRTWDDGGYQARSYQAQEYGREQADYFAPRVMERSGQSRDMVGQVVDSIKENPLPAAVAGAGIGWMFMNRNNSSGEYSGAGQYNRYGSEPGNKLAQAKDKVGEVASRTGDKAGEIAGEAAEAAGEMAGKAADTAGEIAGNVADTTVRVTRQTGDRVGEFVRVVRENPLQAALAGLSIGWLLMRSNSSGAQTLNSVQSRVGETVGQAGEAVGQAAGGAVESVGNVAEGAKNQAGAAQNHLQRMLLDNPLAVGAAVAVVGAAVGLAVPETPQEHQLMGEAHDKLLGKAQEAAQGTIEKVQKVAEEAKQAGQQEARDQGLVTGG